MSAESSYLKKVYVSSTIDDLKKHRAAVIKELEKIQTDPIFMENYVSDDKRPVDKCLADVSRCDIYVGIFAWRYGFIPPGYGKSITELEYRKAADAGKSTLIFLLDEKKDWHHRHFGDAQDQLRINALRNEFKLEKSLKFFTTPKDLANKVIYAIDKLPPKPPEAPKVDKCDPIPPLPKSDKCDRIPILLPQLSGLFKDREDKLGTILHCLRSDDNRLVVIIAPGGYGKTELVTRVLNEIAPRTSIEADDVHGILYIKCAKEEKNILGKIFDGAGEIAGKKDEFEDAYASKMTSTGKLQFFFKELSKVGTVWLVMDNFEDLLDTDDSIKDAEVRDFLEAAAAIKHNVRLIVTSRAIPKFNGSQKIKSIDLEGLPEDYAIDYLKEEGAKCGLDDEDEEVLRAFVKRVHCIPAALVSMIGYLRAHYPGRKLVNILKDDNLFLEFDFHDRNVEKGLKKLISQQIEGLSQDARLALSALSIFSKSTPLEAINYLLPHIKEQDLTAILARLIWNCLIILDNDYYDMQPVIRSCVYERIPESETSDNGKGKDEKAVLPTRSWFHQKAAEFFREKQLKPEEWGTINDLEPQLQEIDHLMRAGQYEKAESVLDSIDYKYLQRWGYHETVIAKREQLIGKLKDIYLNIVNLSYLSLVYMDIGRKYKSLLCLEQALKIVNDNNKGAICANFLYFGTAYANLGETYRAIEYFEQALSIAREDGGSCHERWWLGSLGSAYFNKGETQKAFDYYEQALTLAREIEDKRLKGYQLGSLGSACFKKGDPRKATEYYEQALALAREIGEMKFEGTLLGNFGDAYSVLGETRKAIDYYEQALAIAREIKERSVEGWWLDRLGIVYSNLGETRKAIDYYEQALSIAREAGYKRGEVETLGNIGYVCFIEEDFNKSVEYFLQALEIAKNVEDYVQISYVLLNLAYAFHYHSNLSDAEQYYRESLKLEYPLDNCQSAVLLGLLLLEKGKSADAEDSIKRGISICREILEKTPDLFKQLYKLALALLASGDSQASLETYRKALTICSAKGVVKLALIDLNLLERAAPNIEGLANARQMLTDAQT
ncbi:MAG: tetratricopeptide repeat protein [Nitrospirae bacterium]|nr:tetratricopeptide repeat protein [Nitrospirota bacterium]MBF0615707.1 tetratricopeptide repeat protein [Nitrospirota bacterium]